MTVSDDWTQPELVRAVRRIDEGVKEVRVVLEGQRSLYVPREVWDEAWRGLGEWKAQVAGDVVNLEVGLTRHVREAGDALERHASEHTHVHEALRAHVDERIAAERADRVSGQRWAVGLATTGILGLIGTLVGLLNASGGGA